MYINWGKSNGVHGDETLVSPDISPGSYCLSFWYTMSSPHMYIEVVTMTTSDHRNTTIHNITDPHAIKGNIIWRNITVATHHQQHNNNYV